MKKTYKVHIANTAKMDLSEIFEYISSSNPKRAVTFIKELERNILSLKKFPERNPMIQENFYFNTDYRHLIYKKYRIIYRVSQEDVFIMKIFHGAKLMNFQI